MPFKRFEQSNIKSLTICYKWRYKRFHYFVAIYGRLRDVENFALIVESCVYCTNVFIKKWIIGNIQFVFNLIMLLISMNLWL